MAQQPTDQTGGAGITPSSYTGIANPQFTGGSIDPNTDNLLLPSKQQIAQGQAPTAAAAPTPAAPPPTVLGPVSAPDWCILGSCRCQRNFLGHIF